MCIWGREAMAGFGVAKVVFGADTQAILSCTLASDQGLMICILDWTRGGCRELV